jgi:hypothetical protein
MSRFFIAIFTGLSLVFCACLLQCDFGSQSNGPSVSNLISVTGTATSNSSWPPNPGGGQTVKLTIKNLNTIPDISLSVYLTDTISNRTLAIGSDTTDTFLLPPDSTISYQRSFVGPFFQNDIPYNCSVSGKFQDGQRFVMTQRIRLIRSNS